MQYYTTISFFLNLAIVLGQSDSPSNGSSGWQPGKFKTLVTFGDSYTDENRLGYFANHNGSAPPTGWDGGVVCFLLLKYHDTDSSQNCLLTPLSELRSIDRRADMGPLRLHLLIPHSLQLRSQWRRLFQRDHPTNFRLHQRTLPGYSRLRTSSLPIRLNLQKPQRHRLLHRHSIRHRLRNLDRHQRHRERRIPH